MSRDDTVVSFVREGGETVLLGNGAIADRYLLVHGAIGFGMGPVSFESSAILAGHGSILLGKRIDERDMLVPVLVDASTPDELLRFREHLRRALSPLDERRLYLRIEVVGREGYREIEVHYKDGLGGDAASSFGTWQSLGLEFRAFDALWRGSPESWDRAVQQSTKPFLGGSSFFPVELSGSTVSGRLEVFVAGDAPTWPVWTVVPPGNSVTLTHVGTGKTFALTGTLTETTTIDMSTWNVTSASWPNNELYDRVPLTSEPFPLLPGRNELDLLMPGATSASRVTLTYRPQYLGGE
jgi:hypothetical protein